MWQNWQVLGMFELSCEGVFELHLDDIASGLLCQRTICHREVEAAMLILYEIDRPVLDVNSLRAGEEKPPTRGGWENPVLSGSPLLHVGLTLQRIALHV